MAITVPQSPLNEQELDEENDHYPRPYLQALGPLLGVYTIYCSGTTQMSPAGLVSNKLKLPL